MQFLPETVQLFILIVLSPFYFAASCFLLCYNQFQKYRFPSTIKRPVVPRNILITGSSRGLGKSLALKYASEGSKFIALHGRDKNALEEVKAAIKAKGVEAEYAEIDVRDKDNMKKWIHHLNDRYPLDLVIANAGTSTSLLQRKRNYKRESKFSNFEATIRDLFQINIDGVLNTILPAIDVMCQRHKREPDSFQGQIAIVSSLASWTSIGMYASSKVCVRSLVEGLRPRLKSYNINLNAVCPGFIKSEMTEHRKNTPFVLDPETSADIILYGLRQDKAHIAFPFITHTLCWLYSILPYAIQDRLMDALDIANKDPSGELDLN
eukprot:gb/GECH01003219.1/.p1 GENE.gb/GECH01003219.1/~~gb/GECH01003219.1/.p1  ORF type:complete len:322 (+),score=101.07 gb/GECH01003219.1/:1-966(+)